MQTSHFLRSPGSAWSWSCTGRSSRTSGASICVAFRARTAEHRWGNCGCRSRASRRCGAAIRAPTANVRWTSGADGLPPVVRSTTMLDKSEIRFLRLGVSRLAYEVRGDGPPLVAPAWWVSHLELDWQSPGIRQFWEGVAKNYTLIRYDRLGVGMSDRTVRASDLTL